MSGERKTYKVFISSTYLDNAERRKIVEDAVLRADMQPVGMERFTASVHPTVEECERQARECDIYVGIIAHRYGWIPDGKSISITEIEYDAAKAAQRPSLMFQIDKSVPIDMERDFDEMPGRWAKQEKLDAYRAKYGKDQMPAAPFTDTTLGAKVLHALFQWRETQHRAARKGETNGRARSERVAYDLFLSYAREDQPLARQLAMALQTLGWSVFWDTNTPPGKAWPKWIAEALADARCVVVAWSEASIHSDWVYQEADEGKKRKILVPVLLQRVEPPFGFRHIQAADLIDWHGTQEEEGFQQLVHAVADILSPARPASKDSVVSSSAPRHSFTPAGDSLRVTKSGGVELVLIAGGKFLMGSPKSERDRADCEGPQHNVTVKPFYLGRYPVTNEEYARFMQANAGVKEPALWADRKFNQARQPVVGVSWYEAQRFAEWVGGRLPIEAEWEYAARAGTMTRYWWGDEVGTNNANCVGCGSQWDRKQTAPIGSFQPNAFGFHDMLGNVWEWVQDCWHESYKGGPTDGSAWGEKPGGDCDLRVIRGGSWNFNPWSVRSAYRDRGPPDARTYDLGFRLAQDN